MTTTRSGDCSCNGLVIEWYIRLAQEINRFLNICLGTGGFDVVSNKAHDRQDMDRVIAIPREGVR